jgi:hypothetical protein
VKKANKELREKLFEYFLLEQNGNEVVALGDFADKNFNHMNLFKGY